MYLLNTYIENIIYKGENRQSYQLGEKYNIIILSCICHRFIVIVLFWELKQKIYDQNLISFNQQIKYRYIPICKLKIMQLN